MNIDIEQMDYNEYRVFIYREFEDREANFIDIKPHTSDMPSIFICFPHDNENNVYIIDRWRDVVRMESSVFNFTRLYWEPIPNGKLPTKEEMDNIDKVIQTSDSILSISCAVQLNSWLQDISLWNDKELKGILKNI
ncbi:MAG: hypothetical protein K2G85_08520 [Muribaculaceae bacterium]|nr:hypothetical protein [Muribaculaceae bacterium]